MATATATATETATTTATSWTGSTQEYPAPGKTGKAGRRDPHLTKGKSSQGISIPTIAKKGRRRRQLTLTEKEIEDIENFRDEIHMREKDPKTMGKYSGSQRDWIQLFEQRGWGPLFFDCDTMAEKARRTFFHVAYEVKHQGLLGRSVRQKLSVLHTCTGTITKTKECVFCIVSAIQNLHRVIFENTGAYPKPEDALCKVEEGRGFSRDQISEVLKAGTKAGGRNSDRTASHSLRRGGASAYYCAGVPMGDIKILGRWPSDAHKWYIFLLGTSSIMSKGNVHPTTVVPRFEKN